jgi:uncharacterized protein YdeI (YjbR/CyaY-like superfamily)
MSTEKKPGKEDLPVISFKTTEEWRDWLEQNCNNLTGIWLKYYKKDTGVTSINYREALDEALCYGWIDGQAKPFDGISWLQRFTPRRKRSIWSKRNIGNIARLEAAGRMRPSGLREVEAAKADGRWDKAYDSPVNMSVPDDFLNELSKDKKAVAFFETLNKANKYAIAWRLQTAKKPETREKHIKKILDMLHRGEKFH